MATHALYNYDKYGKWSPVFYANSSGNNFIINSQNIEFGSAIDYCSDYYIELAATYTGGTTQRYSVFQTKQSNGLFIDRDGNKTAADGYSEQWTFVSYGDRNFQMRFKNSTDVMRRGINNLYVLVNPSPTTLILKDAYKIYVNVEDAKNPVPNLSSLSASSTNNYIDNPLSVTWAGNNVGVTKVYVNGSLKTTTAAGVKSVSLPAFTCVEGKNTIKVVTENRPEPNILPTLGGIAEKEIDINMSRIKPTLSNVRIETESTLIDDLQTVSWNSTNQSAYNLKINGINRRTGGTEKTYTIPKYLFNVGENTLEIESVYIAGNGSRSSVSQSIKKTFTRLMPGVSSIAVNNTNRDYTTRLTWSNQNVTSSQVFINNTLISNLTTQTTLDIPAFTFANGKNIVLIRATYTGDSSNKVTTDFTKEFTFTQNEPIIHGLEPSKLNINVDVTNNVTFSTNTYATRWELRSGKYTWSGTNERIINVAGGAFVKGSNTLALTLYYTPNANETRTTSMTVTFTGYGKPTPPTQDQTVVYPSASPTLTWTYGTANDSDRQTECEVKVLEGSKVIYSKHNIGDMCSAEVMADLEDKTQYTSMIRIKNRYDLWSDWSTKNFETLFSHVGKPTMQVYQQESSVAVFAQAAQSEGFGENRIYRRYTGGEWVELAAGLEMSASIMDNTAAVGMVYYKCRSYDTGGGYTESDIYKTDVKLQRTVLCDVAESETAIILSSVTSAISYISDNKTMLFAGASKPRIYKSNTNYKVLTLEVTLGDNAELQNLLLRLGRGQIYCLRDWRGECGYYGITISGIKRSGMYQVLSVTLTEVNFNEYRMYSAGYKDVIYTDGGYILQMR